VHRCLPEDRKASRPPGVARACSSRDGVGTTHSPEVTAVPCQGSHGLKRAAGRYSAPLIVGLGLEAMQSMTNAMNAIANQVIATRAGPRGTQADFDGTFRD
jgi:hypothetical protein